MARPNWLPENQTFHRADRCRKRRNGSHRRAGHGVSLRRKLERQRPTSACFPAVKGQVPGTQWVELAEPETGGANEANRSGPAAGRSSEVQGGRQRGPEARRGGDLTRFRYLAETAGGKPGQQRTQRRWKGTAINNYISESATAVGRPRKIGAPGASADKSDCCNNVGQYR